MVVQQDQLNPTNTNITFSGFNYLSSPASQLTTASGADRVLHNGTDILKASFWGISGSTISQTPQLRYYQTNGDIKAGYTPQYDQLLDICYESTSHKYYTVRYSSKTFSGTMQDPDDNFDSGTTFDLRKWTSTTELIQGSKLLNFYQDVTDAYVPNATLSFTKLSGSLGFSTTLDKKYLQSRYYLPNDFEATLTYNAVTLTGNRTASFGLLATDSVTGHSLYEVGITRSGSNNYYYRAARTNYQQFGLAYLADCMFDTNRLPTGTVDWTLTKVTQSGWTVVNTVGFSGTYTASGIGIGGLQPIVTSGGIDFTLASGNHNFGSDVIQFTTDYTTDTRPSSSGTLYLTRAGNVFNSSNSALFDTTLTYTNPAKVSIVGQNIGSIINVSGDNFNINTGTPVYSGYPVLSIEEINSEGQVQQSIINNFEVLDPTLNYSQLLSGVVNIAVSPSNIMYTKVLDKVYSFTCTGTIGGNSLVNSGTGGITTSVSGLLPASGVTSFLYNGSASTSLNYLYYDSNAQETRLKSLTTAQPPVPSSRQVFLSISDYGSYISPKSYQLFLHGIDTNSLFYVGKSDNKLRQFNIDPSVSAFSAVNSDDYSLQVGTNDTANINVEVINAWGDPLNGKSVAFVLTSGDGVITPTSTLTAGSGVAVTQYTAGALAGPVQIQVTVSD